MFELKIFHRFIEKEEMDMEAMVDDFVTFFIAGQETTANALAFTFAELGKNREIFLKLIII